MSEFIVMKNIEKIYERKIALSSLSLSVNKGELIALIGPSGAGKTTMLNLLAATLSPDRGEITIDGQRLAEMTDQKKRAKKIGIIRQQFDLIGELPVIQNVLAGKLSEWGIFKSLLSLLVPQEKDDAIKALSRVGLREKLYERTSALSGGEQQRVALARLLVQSPEIVLADEPVASLDPVRAEDIMALLVKIASEESQTLIASLHSVEYAKKYFDRLIGLKNGQIFFDLPASSVSDTHIDSLYKLREQA
ncbi:phosphonate ABC transporter ATP-binding protein [Mesobacillus jeotgali]|uniref:phosphonate ABC transporter ATP-binding protein n=1 Tax=Mesobacillus jeotgali TaxID=129985 RepID=UPI0009A73990|nr:phosphonate ABC transporter ATP-binding protein [Mesobacillus jeotgali]